MKRDIIILRLHDSVMFMFLADCALLSKIDISVSVRFVVIPISLALIDLITSSFLCYAGANMLIMFVHF